LDSNIAIPDYQRDYAQGRLEDAKIEATREKFIDDIIKAAMGLEFVHMGLVYGSNNSGLKGFVAVDGQQRLTTAFLFHLYLSKMTESCDLTMLRGRLQKFGWHGRPYASEFTDFLFNTSGWNRAGNSINNYLKSNSHYFPIWERDPTVNNIFTILDTIHNKLCNFSENVLSGMAMNLVSGNCMLVFDSMKLEPDTDEFQYQMMNARGRELTTYELFKQKLQDEVRLHESFKEKMDNKWLCFFDELSFSHNDGYEADVYYQNYINEVALIFSLVTTDDFEYTDTIANSKVKRNSTLNDVGFVPFNAYKKNICNHPNVFEMITDWYVDNIYNLQKIIQEFKFKGVEGDLLSICTNDVTWLSRAILYAVLSFGHRTLRLKGIVEESPMIEKFRNWWRPVYNLLACTDIDKNNFKRISQSIDLLPIEDIYEYISNSNNSLSFNEYQWKEEHLKSKLCNVNPELKELFAIQERRRRFQGQIGVLLMQDKEALTTDEWHTIVNSFNELVSENYNPIFTNFDFVATMFSFSESKWEGINKLKYSHGHLRGGAIPARWVHDMLFDYIDYKAHAENDIERYFENRRISWYEGYCAKDYTEQKDLYWVKFIYDNYDDVSSAFNKSDNAKVAKLDGNLWLYRKTNRNDQDLLITNKRDMIVSHFSANVKRNKHDIIACHPAYEFLKIVFASNNIWIGIPSDSNVTIPATLPEGIFAWDAYKAWKWLEWGKCNNYYENEGESFDTYENRLLDDVNKLCQDFLSRLNLLNGEYIPLRYDTLLFKDKD